MADPDGKEDGEAAPLAPDGGRGRAARGHVPRGRRGQGRSRGGVRGRAHGHGNRPAAADALPGHAEEGVPPPSSKDQVVVQQKKKGKGQGKSNNSPSSGRRGSRSRTPAAAAAAAPDEDSHGPEVSVDKDGVEVKKVERRNAKERREKSQKRNRGQNGAKKGGAAEGGTEASTTEAAAAPAAAAAAEGESDSKRRGAGQQQKKRTSKVVAHNKSRERRGADKVAGGVAAPAPAHAAAAAAADNGEDTAACELPRLRSDDFKTPGARICQFFLPLTAWLAKVWQPGEDKDFEMDKKRDIPLGLPQAGATASKYWDDLKESVRDAEKDPRSTVAAPSKKGGKKTKATQKAPYNLFTLSTDDNGNNAEAFIMFLFKGAIKVHVILQVDASGIDERDIEESLRDFYAKAAGMKGRANDKTVELILRSYELIKLSRSNDTDRELCAELDLGEVAIDTQVNHRFDILADIEMRSYLFADRTKEIFLLNVVQRINDEIEPTTSGEDKRQPFQDPHRKPDEHPKGLELFLVHCLRNLLRASAPDCKSGRRPSKDEYRTPFFDFLRVIADDYTDATDNILGLLPAQTQDAIDEAKKLPGLAGRSWEEMRHLIDNFLADTKEREDAKRRMLSLGEGDFRRLGRADESAWERIGAVLQSASAVEEPQQSEPHAVAAVWLRWLRSRHHLLKVCRCIEDKLTDKLALLLPDRGPDYLDDVSEVLAYNEGCDACRAFQKDIPRQHERPDVRDGKKLTKFEGMVLLANRLHGAMISEGHATDRVWFSADRTKRTDHNHRVCASLNTWYEPYAHKIARPLQAESADLTKWRRLRGPVCTADDGDKTDLERLLRTFASSPHPSHRAILDRKHGKVGPGKVTVLMVKTKDTCEQRVVTLRRDKAGKAQNKPQKGAFTPWPDRVDVQGKRVTLFVGPNADNDEGALNVGPYNTLPDIIDDIVGGNTESSTRLSRLFKLEKLHVSPDQIDAAKRWSSSRKKKAHEVAHEVDNDEDFWTLFWCERGQTARKALKDEPVGAFRFHAFDTPLRAVLGDELRFKLWLPEEFRKNRKGGGGKKEGNQPRSQLREIERLIVYARKQGDGDARPVRIDGKAGKSGAVRYLASEIDTQSKRNKIFVYPGNEKRVRMSTLRKFLRQEPNCEGSAQDVPRSADHTADRHDGGHEHPGGECAAAAPAPPDGVVAPASHVTFSELLAKIRESYVTKGIRQEARLLLQWHCAIHKLLHPKKQTAEILIHKKALKDCVKRFVNMEPHGDLSEEQRHNLCRVQNAFKEDFPEILADGGKHVGRDLDSTSASIQTVSETDATIITALCDDLTQLLGDVLSELEDSSYDRDRQLVNLPATFKEGQRQGPLLPNFAESLGADAVCPREWEWKLEWEEDSTGFDAAVLCQTLLPDKRDADDVRVQHDMDALLRRLRKKFRYTAIKRVLGEVVRFVQSQRRPRFTVFSWNILAEMKSQKQLEQRPWEEISWTARWPRIRRVFDEMTGGEHRDHSRAGIICLQEVQHSTCQAFNHVEAIRAFMEGKGYSSFYGEEMKSELGKNNRIYAELKEHDDYGDDLPDLKDEKVQYCKGVLLCWDQTQFEKVGDPVRVDFRAMHKDMKNCAIVVALRRKGTKQLIVASTAHAPVPNDGKNTMLQLLCGYFWLQAVKEVCENAEKHEEKFERARVVVCGDMNAFPQQPLCTLFKQEDLVAKVELGGNYDPSIFNECGDRLANCDGTLRNPLGGLSHAGLPGPGKPFFETTISEGFTKCIDHIFYCMHRGDLQSAFLGPAPNKVADLEFPNAHVPSDHLWIGAEFTLHSDVESDEGIVRRTKSR